MAKKKPVAKKKPAAKKVVAKKAAPKKPAAKKVVAKKAAPKKPTAKKKAKRKPNPAFMRPLQPDAALGAIVGNKPLPRTQITKKIWAYNQEEWSARPAKQAHDQCRRQAPSHLRR